VQRFELNPQFQVRNIISPRRAPSLAVPPVFPRLHPAICLERPTRLKPRPTSAVRSN